MKLALKLPPQEGNTIERAFGLRLQAMLQAGELLWWKFEPIKLKLGQGAWFCPDFVVLETAGQLTFYETKGFFREAAKVRLKVARELFPFFRFVVVRRTKDGWDYTNL